MQLTSPQGFGNRARTKRLDITALKRINGNLNAEKVASLSYMSKATQMIAETIKRTTEFSGAREKVRSADSTSMEPKKVSTYIAQ